MKGKAIPGSIEPVSEKMVNRIAMFLKRDQCSPASEVAQAAQKIAPRPNAGFQ